MMINTIRSYILYFMLVSSNFTCAQGQKDLYQENNFYHTNNGFYTYGIKWINSSHANESESDYAHASDFYISRYSAQGKKQWELLFDKKRNFIVSSEIHSRGAMLFCLIAVRNRTERMSTISHYLVKVDSLGHLVQELKMKDSSTHLFSGVFYGPEFITVTRNMNKVGVVSEMYDYNFNRISHSVDPLVTAFYYNSKVFLLGSELVSAGACADMVEENKLIASNTMNHLHRPKSYCVKKTGTNRTENPKIKMTQLPAEESLNHVFVGETGGLYLSTVSISRFHKLYTRLLNKSLYYYDAVAENLQLLADTFSVWPIFVKQVSKNEFIYISQAAVNQESSARTIRPQTFYWIKDNKLVAFKILKTLSEMKGKNEFVVEGNKLFVYNINHNDEDIYVKVLDYTDGKKID